MHGDKYIKKEKQLQEIVQWSRDSSTKKQGRDDWN